MITWYVLGKEDTMLHLLRPKIATTVIARADGTGENGGLPLDGEQTLHDQVNAP